MRKLCLSCVLVVLFSVVSFVTNAQWSVTAIDTEFVIDFDNTVNGVNNGVYVGTGFLTDPGDGQLDADAWEITGMSEGDKLFGAEASAGDFARGTSQTLTSGGLYSYEVETGNFAFGMLPAGSDITPGYIAIKMQNNTGEAITGVEFSYDIWVLNWAGRSQSFNGEVSFDGINWMPIDDFLFTTPEVADATPAWVKTSFTSGGEMALAADDYLYFRWYTDDVGGSGSRDRIAIDNIKIKLTKDEEPTGENCLLALDYGFVNDPAVEGSIVASQAVWYKVNLPAPMYNVVFSICGSSFDTQLEVWVNCDDATYAYYNDDFCGTASQITVPDLAAGDYFVKVLGYGTAFGDYVLNITGATCASPVALSATNVTTEGADLSWSPIGAETQWVVEVGLPGFIPGTGAAVVTIEDIANPFVTVTGLNSATAYQFSVKAICGVDNESAWANNVGFTTACEAVSDFPFSMSFDDATFAPVCWTNVKTAGTGTPGTWNRSTTGTNPTCSPKSGAGMARYNCYNLSGGTMGILVTPQLDFPSDNYVVEFWMYRDNGYSTYSNEKVNVYYNTENNLTGAELIGTVSRYYGFAPVEAVANQWYQYSFDLPGGKSGLGYIILEAVSQFGSNIFVDEMNIRAKSTETEIITYSLPGQTGAPVFGDHTIDVEVAIGTDVTALVASFTLSDGASASVLGLAQESGVTPNDFTNPVTYVVTAEDGVTTADWVVSVTEATSLSSENDIVSFSFPQQTGVATIDAENHTVAIEVQWTANIADLTPTITVSPLASIDPESGVARDFSNPVTYTVTAEDASEQIWTVTVSQEAIPAGVDCANAQVVTLPLDAPYADLAQTNCGMLNSYSNSCMGNYDNGEDFIYRLDVTSAVQVTITMDPKTTIYSGLGLLDGCPDTGACIQVATGSGAAPRVITRILQPGTYYLMVDTWASPDCIPVFDLTITAVSCLPPAALTVSNITQGTADVSWTAQLGETVWNLLYGETGFDPLNEGTLVEGASNPYTITGLIESTTYQVYVQTDCGGSVTAWTGPQDFTTLASCPAPTDLTASDISYNQANLQWNANTATEWNIEWGLFGFTQGTGTLIENVSDNPYLLEGLEALTQYSYYVQAVCGAEQSVWAGPYSFTTACAPVTAFPFVQSFDDATFPPVCWTNVKTAGTGTPGTWNRSTTGTNPTCSPKSGAGMARYNCYNLSGGTKGILVTPQLDFPTDNYVVEFWMYRDNGYSTYSNEKVNVYYNTENNLTGAELIGTVSRYYGFAPVEAVANQWYQYSFDLPGGKSGLGYIILEAVSQFGSNIFVDEMNIRAKSTETEIITYSLPGQTGAPVFGDHTIDVEVAIGTDVTALVASFSLSDGASASVLGLAQESGVTPNDFTNPVTYVVTAEDGVTTADWVVSVTEATSLSSENDIVSFSFPQQTGVATIDAENHTVAIEVQWTANIADLTPTITVSPLASIDPGSGVARDFTNPVEYTVTAEDASEQIWTVTVSQEAIPAGVDCANAQVVTLPLDAPYADLAQTNCGMLNSYSNSCMGNYDNGEDFIYRLDVTSTVQVTITMDPKTTSYSGLGLLDGCPDTGACIQIATGAGTTPRVITRVLTAGTYYLMVDTWASPDCIPVFDLTIAAVTCLPPVALSVNNITQTTADVSWTAQLGETVWNLLYGETGFNPLTEGTLVEGASNPFTITGLDEATTYQVYVQTDCGGSVTAWTGPQDFTTLASCPAPTDLTASDISYNQANLQWNANSTTEWNIEWGLFGFTQGTGTLIENVSDNPYLLEGLEALTQYSYYVQAVCGAEQSVWAGPYSFTTTCAPVTAFPFVQSFDDATFPPVCWTNVKTAGTGTPGTWNRSTTGTNPTCSPKSGAGMARYNCYNLSGGTMGILVTPGLDFPADNYQVIFWMYRDNGYLGNLDRVNVYYNTANNLTGATLLGTIHRSWTQSPAAPVANQWYEYTFDMPEGTSGVGYVVFEGVSAFGNNIFVDDVSVQMIPTCPAPMALTASGITHEEALLAWTENGSATSWNIEYGITGFTLGEGTLVEDVANPYLLQGLQELTTYSYYVQSDCADDDQSTWVGPYSFTTLPSCPEPTGLGIENIITSQADLVWVAAGITDLFNIEWGLSGFVQGEGTLVEDVNAETYQLTGLEPNTSYSFYVQANCGSGDYSEWAGPYTFTTTCAMISEYPYFEGFNSATFPNCWSRLNLDGDTYQWSPNTSYVYEGSHSVAIHWNSSGNNDWLISPQFEITSDALILDFFARSTSSSYLESFNVLVSTTGTNPADFTIVLDNVVDHPNAWLNHAYTLADYGINQGDQIYVAIQCVSTDEMYLAVDAFSIREPNTESDIITYSIPQQIEPAGFDSENHIIDVTVGFGTDLSTLVPVFTLSEGATASVIAVVQQSGVSVVDFTGGSAVYNVVAEDGVSSTDWTVNVTVAPINTEANILTYGFDEQTEPANINSEYQMIYVNINWWADITNLIANFTLSYGATARIDGDIQQSGVTVNNFDHTIYYDVTAEDGETTLSWEVNVTQDAAPQNLTCNGAIDYTINDPDQTGYMPAQYQYYYLVTLPTDYTNVRMMTCGSDFDTKLAYFASCDDIPDLSSCPANPAGNLGYVDDGGCGSQSYGGSTLASYLNIGNLSAGTYVAVVYGYGVTSNGNFQFRVLGDAVLVTDLAVDVLSGYTCPVAEMHVPVEISNEGETTVVAGETINFVLEIEEVEVINEDFVLVEDLTPGQATMFETVNTIDLSQIGTLEWRASINYTADENGENNVVEGFVTVFEQAIEFVDTENDTITVESWPYTITANAVVNPTIPFDTEYLWEGGETTNTLEVNEEGWYILTVITADCEYQDSVYIVYYNRIPQFDVNGFSLYPNPTAGLFVIDVTLPEQSNAVITITDALGRTIEVINVSNTDTYRRQVDMSGYAEGVYNITLNYAEQTITKRLTLRK